MTLQQLRYITLFNLLIGLKGYTVSSGVISKELNGETIVAKPLEVKETMQIGIVTQKNMSLSAYAKRYIECLQENVMNNEGNYSKGCADFYYGQLEIFEKIMTKQSKQCRDRMQFTRYTVHIAGGDKCGMGRCNYNSCGIY